LDKGGFEPGGAFRFREGTGQNGGRATAGIPCKSASARRRP
jgi:hypothetical protein